MTSIPFTKPFLTGRELEYVTQAIESGKLDSDGPFTRRCAALLEERFDIRKVLMTPSCTSALELAALLCDLQPGDEVIMPSYTFVSTANAVVLRGAVPVFVDIRPDTLNLDENLIEAAITSRTKAIFAVHYAGVGCEMDTIMDIAERHHLLVVEDAAQGVNAFYKGRALGSIGHLGCYSFHTTKNYVCGEGGALCINDPELIERAEILREKGTNRSKFYRGQVDKYTWVDVGGSHLPSELSCAFLLAQLEELDSINGLRQRIWETYREQLTPFATDGVLQLPQIPAHCSQNYHLFHALVADGQIRDELLSQLRSHGIGAVFHYIPLHSAPAGQAFGRVAGSLPVTSDSSERLIRLPLYAGMTDEQLTPVIEQLAAICQSLPLAVTPQLVGRDNVLPREGKASSPTVRRAFTSTQH